MTHFDKEQVSLFMLAPGDTMLEKRARWAEERGFSTLWIPDGGGKMHALTMAAAMAASTSKINIGTGIVPVYTHTPAVLAAATSAMAHLAPNRFIMGVGSSSEAMINGWHGMPFVKPLTRVKETILALREMLDGKVSNFDGDTLTSHGFRLNPPPSQPVPIYMAALRSRMLELAGAVADGVILHLVPLAKIAEVLQAIARGAQSVGRSPKEIKVVCRLNVTLCDDRKEGLQVYKRFLLPYFATGVYQKFLAWSGFPEQAAQVEQGFKEKSRKLTAEALDDDLLTALGVIGNVDACRAQAAEFLSAGVDQVAISAVLPHLEGVDATFQCFAP